MKATVLDLRRRTKEIIEALDRGESVTITCRGKEKGTIVPARPKKRRSITESPFFGMWKDNRKVQDVEAFIQRIRRPRYYDI